MFDIISTTGRKVLVVVEYGASSTLSSLSLALTAEDVYVKGNFCLISPLGSKTDSFSTVGRGTLFVAETEYSVTTFSIQETWTNECVGVTGHV